MTQPCNEHYTKQIIKVYFANSSNNQIMDVLATIFILCLVFSVPSKIDAHRSSHKHKHRLAPSSHKHRPAPTARTPTTYDVREFGAVGDGENDDTKAFELAWEAACSKRGGTPKISVTGGKTFLVSPIHFKGPCTSNSIIFEILGSIIAPPKSAWKQKGADEWLHFHQVDGLTVVGNGQGLIDGRGATWWENGDDDNSRPTAMRFSHCNKLHVGGLKHINSQKNHVSITGCNDATISNLQISAPPKSPNTDGIDISSSTNLHILDSTMSTGDDCIAINGGTSNVIISNIKCGPGHGISIGSLGKKGKHEEVEGIQISNCIFNRTDNGVRIKTWQGGSGFARDITFSQITFIAAKNPVIIDQYYCPHKKCADKKSAVKISNVKYSGLHGTSIGKNAAIDLRCSQTVPCTNIILNDVDIKSDVPYHSASAHCINAHGRARALNPSLNCLQK